MTSRAGLRYGAFWFKSTLTVDYRRSFWVPKMCTRISHQKYRSPPPVIVTKVKIFMRWFQTALEIGKLVRDFRLIRLITPTKWRMGSVCSEGKIPQSHIWIARSTCSRASPRAKPSLWVPEFPHGYPKLRFGPPPVNLPTDGRFGWCPD